MNQENLRPNLKSQPKNLHPRGSLPARHSRQSTHSGQHLVNLKLVGSQEAPIKSGKLNTSHDYLIRKQNIVRNEQNQVQKLTQICHQFYKQNEYLKSQIHAKNEHQAQTWLARISELEQQLARNREFLEERDRVITDLTTNRRKFNGDQNINPSNQHPVGRIVLSKAQRSNSQAQRVLRLTQELNQREQELVRFMHKESEYIRIYVQNEQLEQQIRSMMAAAEQQSKIIEGLRRKQVQPSLKSMGNQHDIMSSLQMAKQYNDKLYKKLEVSSQQIDRLNHILKLKLTEVESIKAIALKFESQLSQLKSAQKQQIEIKQKIHQADQSKNEVILECKQCRELTAKITQLQNVQNANEQNQKLIQDLNAKLRSAKEENENFSSRINDQVDAAWQLRQIITELESKLKLKQSRMEEKQSQTENLNSNQNQFPATRKQPSPPANVTQDPQLIQQKMSMYQERLKSLREENEQLYKFVMQQGQDIQSIRAEAGIILQQNEAMKAELNKMGAKEQEIAFLLNRISTFQEKLSLVTERYEKLLNEAQSSFSETESVHKQIQMMLEDKLDILSQDNKPVPRKQKSEVGKNIRLRTYTVTDSKHIEGSPSHSDVGYSEIQELKKQSKSQSQSQLLGNI